MDVTLIFVGSYVLAAVLGLTSLFFAGRIRSGRPIAGNVRFLLAMVVCLAGFGLIFYWVVPLWAAVFVSLVLAVIGGFILAHVPSQASIEWVDKIPWKVRRK